jgi:hypothetical protein
MQPLNDHIRNIPPETEWNPWVPRRPCHAAFRPSGLYPVQEMTAQKVRRGVTISCLGDG